MMFLKAKFKTCHKANRQESKKGLIILPSELGLKSNNHKFLFENVQNVVYVHF